MSVGSITAIFAGIIGVAMLATFLGSGNTASIIKNIFDGFSSSLKAAMGNK